MVDIHPALHCVHEDMASGHADQILLDFDACNTDGRAAKRQDKADHAAAGPEFQKALVLMEFDKRASRMESIVYR